MITTIPPPISWSTMEFKGLGQRYPNKNRYFDNAENRKINETVLEMSIDESVMVLVSLYRPHRHPATFYDNHSTSRNLYLVHYETDFFLKKNSVLGYLWYSPLNVRMDINWGGEVHCKWPREKRDQYFSIRSKNISIWIELPEVDKKI